MKVFVTGATGFIGSRLVQRLAKNGLTVHALYRSDSKTKPIRCEGVVLFKGDILDEDSLLRAMKGCEQAYHVAAFAGVWAIDRESIFRFNVDGALNVIGCARKAGISRVVVTSTAGILGPAEQVAVTESSPDPDSFFTDYEESKARLETRISELMHGLPEVILVNPTRVYGPGILSESNGVTRMIGQYISGKWKFLPGTGKSSGNYVFVEDVVEGHLLAMERGNPGERYILGGENITYRELFNITSEISGLRYPLIKIPYWIMLTAAAGMKTFSSITGQPPLIVPDLVRKFNHNWLVSSEKAMEKLGYRPMDARAGIKKTIEWLKGGKPSPPQDEVL